MRELFYVIQYDSLVKLVNYWQLANCRLYKLETNTFLERVDLVHELARCIGFLRREMKKVTVQGVLEIHPTTGINDAKFDM